MKTKTYSEEDLEALGYENTGMFLGKSPIFQNHDERIAWDEETGLILSRWIRERKECCTPKNIRPDVLSVRQRQHT